ncbi:MAG TPA: tetratricopeptide repeat protein [Thermoanaerobaculia bacterium]|nr:tetratricopeptide repeat protein [Thermoanaerobaculia bacterium]
MEAHLAGCPPCSANLAFIHWVDAGLRDPEVWEIADRDASHIRAAIRDAAAQVAAEDDEAERLLHELIAIPGRLAFSNLGARRRYHTAGVVRRLLRAADVACDSAPLDALTFADSAIAVSERLTGYPPSVVHDLRANAWKERANALTTLGQYDAALDALDHAEREFDRAPGIPLGRAVVQHARAIVYAHRGDFNRAGKVASETIAAYAQLGQTDRYMRARHLMANLLFTQGDIRGASAIYEELLAWGEAEGDLHWVARASNTLGRCALELGNTSAAVQSFHKSIAAFRELGMSAEVLRPEWGMALVVLASDQPAEALRRLDRVRAAFHTRSMLTDEALVSLDMMDALHALARDSEIVALATQIIQTFTRAGMLTSALTAFAYLKEAATRGAVTPRLTKHVRDFLSDLERQPALLFCPPNENI